MVTYLAWGGHRPRDPPAPRHRYFAGARCSIIWPQSG
jgi:hypothetical protein